MAGLLLRGTWKGSQVMIWTGNWERGSQGRGLRLMCWMTWVRGVTCVTSDGSCREALLIMAAEPTGVKCVKGGHHGERTGHVVHRGKGQAGA